MQIILNLMRNIHNLKPIHKKEACLFYGWVLNQFSGNSFSLIDSSLEAKAFLLEINCEI